MAPGRNPHLTTMAKISVVCTKNRVTRIMTVPVGHHSVIVALNPKP